MSFEGFRGFPLGAYEAHGESIVAHDLIDLMSLFTDAESSNMLTP